MEKKILKAIITGGKDDFGVYIENLSGAYGAGETVEDAKKSLEEAIELLKVASNEVTESLKNGYCIEYSFDTSGFLKHYSKFISFAGMKEITGINRKQLWNYAYGYRNPNKETSEKIFKAMNEFASEICHVKIAF